MIDPRTSPLPLKDIYLPPEPGIWPLAPGWWALLLLACLVVFAGGRWLWRRYRRRVYWRQLDTLFTRSLATSAEPSARLAIVSQLLRRAARVAAGDAAGQLTGEQWLQFLDGEDPGKPYTQGPGRALLAGPFQPSAQTNAVAVSAADALEPIVRQRFMQLAMIGYGQHPRSAPDLGSGHQPDPVPVRGDD